jgi:hypothetical protein
MRSFLSNLNIVGAVLMSRTGELSHYCLRSLLLYCDHIVIVLDNPDDATKKLMERYAEKYREIEIVISPYKGTTAEEEEKDPLCVKGRFKNLQGQIRELVFARLRELNVEKKVDLLLFPDSDEMYGKCLPELLERFWKSDYKSINMKAADVFGIFDTIHDCGLTGHPRVFKFFPELTGIPHRFGCRYIPLVRSDFMGDRFNLIHLSYLTKENIAWKVKYWSRAKEVNPKMLLWRVGKDVRDCTPQEIAEVYKRPADCTVEDYLRGGGKRCPCGEENLSKALLEANNLILEMGIKPILLFGTCLLLYRDKGKLNPLDWDVDFGILAEDLSKLDEKIFLNNGWTDYKLKRDIPKWRKEDGTESEENAVRTISFRKFGVRVDIDIIYLSKCEKYRYVLKGRKREKFVSSGDASWFNNFNKIEYRGVYYNIPCHVEQYLESQYGKDWKTPKYGPMLWSDRSAKKDYYEIK